LAAGAHGRFHGGEEHNGVVSSGTCEPAEPGLHELRRDISGGLASAAIRILGGSSFRSASFSCFTSAPT